jgi:hypothetical protein
MMRSLLWILVCWSILSTASAAPDPKPNANPVCLYESKTYSEGAFVCVQKSLMLTCTADGGRMSWKPVTDKDVNDRCTAPIVQHDPERPIHRHRRHVAVRRAFPWFGNPAKCFVFNGRQYCE